MLLPERGVFSGADMVAGIYFPKLGKFRVFGELSTVSYSIHRELYPVRGLGTINPKGFTRGPRTVAGSLVFTVFDRHVLYEAQTDLIKKYQDQLEQNGYGRGGRFSDVKFVTDEIPPFDIIISMANAENPVGASLRIHGVRITNEGQVMSIEDMITENTMQYLATGIELMEPNFEAVSVNGKNPVDKYDFASGSYELSPSDVSFNENGGSGMVQVINQDTTERQVGPWKATVQYADGDIGGWIHITSQPIGFGSGKIYYSIDPLPYKLDKDGRPIIGSDGKPQYAIQYRAGSINISGDFVTIQQGVGREEKH